MQSLLLQSLANMGSLQVTLSRVLCWRIVRMASEIQLLYKTKHRFPLFILKYLQSVVSSYSILYTRQYALSTHLSLQRQQVIIV